MIRGGFHGVLMKHSIAWFVVPFLILTSLSFAETASTAPTASSRDALSIPPRADVLRVMKKAADYQLDQQAKGKFSNGWVRAAFYTGVMALYDVSHEQKYLDAALHWSEQADWTPTGHNKKSVEFADNQACTQVYCELYFFKPDPRRIEPSKTIFDAQIASPIPGREQWWWCDSLFMAPPAFARMSKATGDPKYDRFLAKQWWDTTDFLFDKSENLYFRDKNYFNKKTPNGKKVFWSRGNGWVMAGIVRVLEALPPDSPERARFMDLLKKMSSRLITLQGSDGLWRSSLLDPQEFPNPETSGTVFYCYAMAWGVNRGVLDRSTYLPHVLNAWRGLVSKVTPEGKLGYVQKVAGAPGKVNPQDTHEYAVGGFLLAGSEVLNLGRNPQASARSRSVEASGKNGANH
jgi:rhamnogalacturonyl hydrolase YesR